MSHFKHVVSFFILLLFFNFACENSAEFSVPEIILEKKMTKLISDDEAVKVIDQLHGLDVTPEKNIIAEYGEDPKDVLYISRYSSAKQAGESFKLMIEKMLKSESGPFTHIQALPDYNDNVYFTIGMGAIHYIFHSERYVLWLQTYQEIGRELPDNILKLYPL
jgi:hypothetical protein